MKGKAIARPKSGVGRSAASYGGLVAGLGALLDEARRASARVVNALMTATYWEIGRRIVEFEQHGEKRAGYGEDLLGRLASDLTSRFGRGFSQPRLYKFRQFHLAYPTGQILSTPWIESSASILSTPSRESAPTNSQTVSGKSHPRIPQTPSAESTNTAPTLRELAERFPLPWSHYVRLLSVESLDARRFYEAEALRGGWSVRQLDRQVSSKFYERTALSRKKTAMLEKGERAQPGDAVSAEEEIRDPFVLEFLGLKDEYSESDLEEALLRHVESFLLELGGDFAFVGRQRRLRIGGEWFRVDLLFFHRKLRCLVIIDLKVGKFTHADAGQMHTYLAYARKHWTHDGENPPVGLILCSEKDDALAKYALEGLPNKVVARDYKLALPDEKRLVAEIEQARQRLEARRR